MSCMCNIYEVNLINQGPTSPWLLGLYVIFEEYFFIFDGFPNNFFLGEYAKRWWSEKGTCFASLMFCEKHFMNTRG